MLSKYRRKFRGIVHQYSSTLSIGGVREWLNRAVSKTVIEVILSRVRIPPSPQPYENRALKPITISSSYRFFYGVNSVMEFSGNIVNSMYYMVVRGFL